MELREAKQILRAALANATEEKLAEMLAWAQDGKMDYYNLCACFVGSIGSDHVHEQRCAVSTHYFQSSWLFPYASVAYGAIGISPSGRFQEARQRRIVPIIKAQIRLRSRRAILQAQSADSSERVLSHPEEKSLVLA